MAEHFEFEDNFYETGSSSEGLIRLSHLNNKSSVLCPVKQDITSQYIALQQLDAHQRMIARAKSIVDSSAPKSLQSYISVADKQRKKRWQKVDASKNPYFKHQISFREQTPFSEEDDNASLNASSLNKGVQTRIPFESASSKTADKISWYLEAIKHGELFINLDNSKTAANQNDGKPSISKPMKKIKGDFMDDHERCFVQPKKPFSPRILANSSAKPKLKDMKCYNPPFRKKKSVSSHSSDTFESYENEEESEDAAQKSSATSSIEEEPEIKTPPQAAIRHLNSRPAKLRLPIKPTKYTLNTNREYLEHACTSDTLTRSEEDEYLNFLSKVTEDILRSGVYSDKAIQQSFEFHMQFYKEESNKEKLQSLLNQVLDGLKISSDDQEESISHRNPLHISFSRPNTPPEKESLGTLLSAQSPLDSEALLNISAIQDQNLNLYPTNEASQVDIQNSHQESYSEDES